MEDLPESSPLVENIERKTKIKESIGKDKIKEVVESLDSQEIASNEKEKEITQIYKADSFNDELARGLEEEFLNGNDLTDDEVAYNGKNENVIDVERLSPANKYSDATIKKAVNDKKFAQDLADHEIAGEIADIEKASERNKKELKVDIEKFKKELPTVFNEIRKKFISFHKKFSGSEEGKLFTDKLEGTINGYAQKIHEFDVIDIYDTKTLTKINQLHHEMEIWLDKNWDELYERKVGRGAFKKETETESVLEDLNLDDLHGNDSFATERIKKAEQNKKIDKIESKDEEKINQKNLSEEERIELVSLISEKWADVERGYNDLMKKFYDFRKSNEGEIKYHKLLFKKTLDINEKKVTLKKVINGNIQINQELLNDLIDLDKDIIEFISSDWDRELKEFKGEIEFTPEEKEIIKNVAEAFGNFMDSLKEKSSWDEYDATEKETVLKILTSVEIKKTIKEMGIAEYKIKQFANSVMDIILTKK
ncbi:MAG: hypothetical protein WC682_00560 [Parcubacteria group bacterium]